MFYLRVPFCCQYCHLLGWIQTGFWTRWLDSLHLIHTTRDYRHYSAIADIHTVTHALVFPIFTSRVLVTDLWQSYCNFKSHMKSSLRSLINFFPFRLSHLRLPSRELDPIHDNNSLLPWNFSLYSLGADPTEKNLLLLSRIVLGVFIDPLPSNRRPIIARVGSRVNVFTEPLPSIESICHNNLRSSLL
jgi:hypothetical protein